MTMSPVTFLTKIRDFAKVRSLFSRIGSSLFKCFKNFFQNESVKAVMAHTFTPGVRNGNTGVSRREIAVFDPQAWQSRLRRDTWQVYGVTIQMKPLQEYFHMVLSIFSFLQNEIWDLSWILILNTFGSERVKLQYVKSKFFLSLENKS